MKWLLQQLTGTYGRPARRFGSRPNTARVCLRPAGECSRRERVDRLVTIRRQPCYGRTTADPPAAQECGSRRTQRRNIGEHVEFVLSGAQDSGAAPRRVSSGAREDLWHSHQRVWCAVQGSPIEAVAAGRTRPVQHRTAEIADSIYPVSRRHDLRPTPGRVCSNEVRLPRANP